MAAPSAGKQRRVRIPIARDQIREAATIYFSVLGSISLLNLLVRAGYLPLPLLGVEALPWLFLGWFMPIVALFAYAVALIAGR